MLSQVHRNDTRQAFKGDIFLQHALKSIRYAGSLNSKSQKLA